MAPGSASSRPSGVCSAVRTTFWAKGSRLRRAGVHGGELEAVEDRSGAAGLNLAGGEVR